MRSVVIDAPGQIRIDNRPDPVLPGPGGAIIAVGSAAICGSDLHFYEGDYPLVQPVALGHEAIGTVVEAGPDVRNVAVGDLVLVSSVAGCGHCAGCATHDPVCCVQGPQIFGAGVLGGAQSELLAVPTADFQLLKIPEGIDTEEALLLTDNLATGWAGAQRADIPPGGTVVVIGLGAVGLCAVRSAIVQGAGQVFAVDPVEGRRERASLAGATAVEPSALAAVLEATGGRGAAAVIDAVGNDATMTEALAMVRAGGTVSVIGVHDLNPFPFPATLSLIRSITLRMTTAPVQRTWGELIPLIQCGRLDTGGIFTHTMPLADAAAGYAAVAARTSDCVKVTLSI
ncbi:alcohol dehydrogenase catalytic domain-containing protein [Mycolicibacterium fallax]|jgi:2-desacetyl-2-hydroxyethyl bacteriochlorophyllide A dehydrogenase|uniref:Dehydrogenase n=1 Tax=Mycolicibacterium fallax TaxID=1793 RepID=A0A1X1R636_MYCFA|nr:alcohol dehydrogenase catalytic domain-containing protein [Mycolicibacterium fallax]ORV00045.1 dehydrogenase [Mycolicibacterium fallax]BBY99105.1 putative zinc-binding alcohol dehydrogenase [Mycolicibacterium fallax]HOW94972.1 alcohol dehydrogenase catalytic domain-containing protein [Mycolicibacterium fallax]HSA39971.1 alcohol dehydrogenase catalytic domain-containing protein [Mycobacterium sp.]